MRETIRRELTKAERKEIKRMVYKECANFGFVYGCLPLDCECIMINTLLVGVPCKYFRKAVLPMNRELEITLNGGRSEQEERSSRVCSICGRTFKAYKKKAYCSEKCREKAHRIKSRERMRKMREK